jgi:iron complex outermembrane receptor protein
MSMRELLFCLMGSRVHGRIKSGHPPGRDSQGPNCTTTHFPQLLHSRNWGDAETLRLSGNKARRERGRRRGDTMFRQSHHQNLVQRFLGGSALAALLTYGSASQASTQPLIAQAAQKTLLDLPAQPLANALNAVGIETNSEVLFAKSLVAGRMARALKGNYAPGEALAKLLGGTDLRVEQTAGNIFLVKAGSGSSPPVRLAAASTGAAGGIETVVVTAQHKSENIQQVPIAITALSQKDLTDRQIAAGPDLLRDVPNMNFTKTNFSGYDIELRGIGTQAISVTTDPAVAVAFNDTPFIRNHFFEQEFYDLQDAEVLLGPQGTLYGRNATAGVVNLKSALPTDTYEAMLSADMGNYSNRRLEAMINIPIVGDQLDIRFAGEWTKRDGYTEDTTLNTPVDGRDLWSGRMTIGWKPASNLQTYFVWEHFSEDDDRLRSGKQLCETDNPPSTVNGVTVPGPGGRGVVGPAGSLTQAFLSQGCQATSLYSSTAYQVPYGPSLPYVIALQEAGDENAGLDPYAETTQSSNLRDIQSAILPTYKAKNDTLEFNATYNVSSALTLTSQTGFNQDFLWSTEDYNRFNTTPGIFQINSLALTSTPYCTSTLTTGCFVNGPNGSAFPDANTYFCDPQLGCSDRLVAQDLDEEHAWQLSQEFRLASNFGGPFNFSVGGNYLHYETEENYYVFSNALSAYAYTTGDEDGGAGGGNSTPSCLFTSIDSHGLGYQSPNPVLGGGGPLYACVYADPNPIGSLNNEGHNYFLSQNPYTLNSYALFGETYYNITNDIKLTTGLRWTDDQKHFVDIPSELLDQGYGYSVDGIENQSWQRFTGRTVLDWSPDLSFTDQTLLYASYAHGYKAGGANPPGAEFLEYGASISQTTQVPFVVHPLTFKPEYIEAFELGTKNTLLDNTLTLNGDIFYYNYTGYQISEIVDRTAINNNYNAHVEGAEVTANWEPVPGLKFNFAGGWEDTVAAGGDAGIDLMDRTAGMPGWMVVKPFPTEASNCILPTYVVAALLTEENIGGGTPVGGGNYEAVGANSYACEVAYTAHLDPVTELPYVANPPGGQGVNACTPLCAIPPDYPGFNPLTPAYNNGEGFAKNLAGHALPNAPPLTVSLGGEYSMPVSEDWVATFRSDFYWQADSWARIFNDNPYDRIDGYTNVNVALILTSANSWQVMGYVKNVFNVTAITGDFLNSDDSGLTTNVFLTDPRLYGIRVTKHLDDGDGFWGKEWSGADWIKDIFADTDNGKPPLWIELGGQLEHIQGQGAAFVPGFYSNFGGASILHEGTTPLEAQQPPLFSAGEEAKVSFEPDGSDWVISAAVRYGRSGDKMDVHHQTDGVHQKYLHSQPFGAAFGTEKFVDTHVYHQESHSIMDFMAGKDVGLGLFGEDLSTVLSGGVRFAQFSSYSSVDMRARPDLHITYLRFTTATKIFKEPSFHTYHAYEDASRKFHGVGPTISWTGSAPVMGNQEGGLDFDWGANAALLFGRQKAGVRHQETGRYWPNESYHSAQRLNPTAGGHASNKTVTVPNLGGFAGVSYRYQNAKISLGYRTDFFFGAIDGGIDKPKSETLNMSGPFATISFGIGG